MYSYTWNVQVMNVNFTSEINEKIVDLSACEAWLLSMVHTVEIKEEALWPFEWNSGGVQEATHSLQCPWMGRKIETGNKQLEAGLSHGFYN